MKADATSIQGTLSPSPAAIAAVQMLLSPAPGVSSGVVATRVRDTLFLDEAVIYECINEAVGGLDAHRAEVFRRHLSVSEEFGASIKRLTVDLGVVLSLAKTFESDDDFIDAAGLLHDVKFSAHGGQVADFALLLIETDMQNAQDAKAGRPSADAVLYELLAYDVIKRRLQTLHAFVRVASGRLLAEALH